MSHSANEGLQWPCQGGNDLVGHDWASRFVRYFCPMSPRSFLHPLLFVTASFPLDGVRCTCNARPCKSICHRYDTGPVGRLQMACRLFVLHTDCVSSRVCPMVPYGTVGSWVPGSARSSGLDVFGNALQSMTVDWTHLLPSLVCSSSPGLPVSSLGSQLSRVGPVSSAILPPSACSLERKSRLVNARPLLWQGLSRSRNHWDMREILTPAPL